jgi:hypothetical protein
MANGMAGLTYKCVDTMKWQKDVMRSQVSEQLMGELLDCLCYGLHPTHIAIAPPMDPSADYPAPAPSPNTAWDYAWIWASAIHGRGCKVLWRGTLCGIEGIYDFTPQVGSNRIAGSAHIQKIVNYINGIAGAFENGDIFAPLPERTQDIFNDATAFLPSTGAGLIANYSAFFNDLFDACDVAFAANGKSGVITGLTSQNFSEVNSGWLPMSMYAHSGVVTIDHYGSTHTVAEMEANLRYIHGTTGLPLFLQEWSDYWNGSLDTPSRTAYLAEMYNLFGALADEGILIGFNYWGGWPDAGESIVELV